MTFNFGNKINALADMRQALDWNLASGVLDG
jgi:hypothetical protein